MRDPGAGVTGARIAGIFVTYNPEADFGAALEACSAQTDLIVVVDNASGSSGKALVTRVVERCREPSSKRGGSRTILLHLNDQNQGLSVGFNEGARLAKEAGATFLLFLDQDSILSPGALQALRESYERLHTTKQIGALNCLNLEPRYMVLDNLSGRLHQSRYRRGEMYSEGEVEEVTTVINSGLLLSRNVFEEVLGYDERLFVDAIDNDLSYRLRKRGYRLFRVKSATLTHNTETPLFRLGPVQLRPHGLFRQYHIVHDTLRVVREWSGKFPLSCLSLFSEMAVGTMFRLLYLKDRAARMRVIIHALFGQGFPADR